MTNINKLCLSTVKLTSRVKFVQIVKLISVLGMGFTLIGCAQSKDGQFAYSAPNFLKCFESSQATASSNQLWGRLKKNFHMSKGKEKADSNHKNVKKYIAQYTQQEKTIQTMSLEASPYLYYIVEELEKRNMPGELALLPMIESAFKPHATSNKGAAGLWQFIPGTGKLYGLKQDAWYDGRRDIKASTRAALDYLQYLHSIFNQNWMLALAAYNAGEGRIQQAIQNNIRKGRPTNFWALELPKETREYVPKLLALASVMANHERHEIVLPLLENKPYFAHVNPGKHLTFVQVAKLADLQLHEVKKLNAGYRKAGTHPKGPQELLLPVANIPKFQYNLTKNVNVKCKK